ncbi:MAG TPA: sulfur carrier protein ThiS adenylyltransferase ThiF [Bacteroidia bacterium]|nr:sulfur carrier protein ThiS adenylyltransferase ThiF [Bacteroidia bacterium]HRS59834.1 sulfur carrier protein ThiS adenylyltransferase ThiF [Bacteroidia bacterium]HRU68931.1 sulfur carrier protein ThiS adenylyltransferase ThiF [Bacteroidia bacterium]
MNFSQIKSILSEKTVGIAGAGGLGSNCASALARVGIGKIIIADFDIVEESNLNRQFYFFHQIGTKKADSIRKNLLMINPGLKIESYDVFLTPENVPVIFKDCDVVVEAFDKADQKKMLIETILSSFPEKPLVIGLGMAGFGMNDTLKTVKNGNLYICGDGVSEIADDLPPIAPRVGIVANMQANTVLEILLKEHDGNNPK